MYIDKELLISDGQSLSSSGANPSTYSVDLEAVRDIGKGRQLYVVVIVDTAPAVGDAADTVTISLITDDAVGLGSPTTILSLPAITGANLTVGRVPIVIPIPQGIAEQYLGLNYQLSAAFTAFTVSAFIALDVQTNL